MSILRSLTLPVLLVLSGFVVVSFSAKSSAAIEQSTSNGTSTDKIISQFRRCQGQWHYRCADTVNDVQTSVAGQATIENSALISGDEPAFKRCGRLWQYRCTGQLNTQETPVNFARQEYLINDEKSVYTEHSTKMTTLDNEPEFRRCGRLWQLRCGGRR